MRWPFRRKPVEPTGAVERPQRSDAPAVRAWATLPVIPVTIPRAAPLVVGPAPVVPPLRLGERGSTGPVEPPIGTVIGLALSVVRAPEPVAPGHTAPGVPLVRRAVRSVPPETAPLVDAVDEYVGTPREPAVPHRAPGWLRYTPDWLKPSQVPDVVDVPVTEPPSFLPLELRSAPELPPQVTESVQPAAPLPVRKRRPNLGQSRRLGLGAPITKAELVHPEEPPPIVDGTVETPQEPPSPSAAPARVAPEEPTAPAPEPPTARAVEQTPSAAEHAPDRGHQDPPDEGPPPSSGGPLPPRAAPTEGPPVGATPQAKSVATVYRATAELRPAPRRRAIQRATVVDRVPDDLATEVRTRQQADVSSVPVYRGAEVGAAARSRGARAFASGGAVFLPDEAGPVDAPRARGLLAHELVHAVQQRTFGSRLPAPDSPLGQHLEAEAQAAERFYSGEAGAAEPPPLIHAPLPVPAPEPEPNLTAPAQLATQLAPTPTPTAPQAVHSPFDAVTTAEVGKIATESAKHVVAEWTNPALQQKNAGATGQTAGGHAVSAGLGAAAAGGTPAFNAGARREQLVTAALAMRNATLAPGASPVMHLTDEELNAIDRQVTDEAGQHGAAAEPAQHYVPNSADGWMHAITGMNMNYGFGETGHNQPVGSANSWWGSETGDKRPVDKKLADQFGLINENTETQFDMDTWFEPTEDKKDAKKDDQAAGGANQPAQHEDSLYGRPNPDRSTVDINKIDLDELATRLYDRLRSRLRIELLVDRERAGLLTDFR